MHSLHSLVVLCAAPLHDTHSITRRNPTGHYKLQLNDKHHRAILNTLLAVQAVEAPKGPVHNGRHASTSAAGIAAAAGDTSQHRNR
jgi:hypothetical protein